MGLIFKNFRCEAITSLLFVQLKGVQDKILSGNAGIRKVGITFVSGQG